MQLLVIADINDIVWEGPTGQADVLVSCGDVADSIILQAAEAFGCRAILAVKGNHDSAAPFPSPIVDLHRHVMEFEGVTFAGLHGCWRYKPKGHFLYDQDDINEILRDFPAADVFVAHNSPQGIHDRDDDVHVGFYGLKVYAERTQPKLLIHGHQHVDRETVLGQAKIIGIVGHRLIEL